MPCSTFFFFRYEYVIKKKKKMHERKKKNEIGIIKRHTHICIYTYICAEITQTSKKKKCFTRFRNEKPL